ncbi:MAG: hypothetical protein HOP13_07545 [Alphaproteobacteria bacterium]|nr:hypothetical protein [Alphaproteobacteria bacterium]
MRVFFAAAVSVLFAAVVIAAPTAGKPPKAVDIKKELGEKCGSAPYGLVDLNGKTASKLELEEAKFQVTGFITQADVYQDCVYKLAETHAAVLTDNDKRLLGTALKVSQDEKEAVGAAFNTAICEYNAANKIPDADCKDGKWIQQTVAQKPAKPAATPAKPAAAKPAAPATPKPQ